MLSFLLLTIVGASTLKVSPVQKVVQLLDELKTKVADDLSNEAKLMDEFTAWCDEEANLKEDAITSSKRTIADNEATIQDASATIGSLTSEISELTTKISTSEADLSKATSLREEEHNDFLAGEKELLGTVDSLERAASVLKRNLGLLQGGKVQAELKAMEGGLQKVIDASWINTEQKGAVQALLQAASGDEDMDLQPQAQTQAYSSQSGGIVDTVTDMQAKAEESLGAARKAEMEGAHAYAMLKQGAEDEIKVMRDQLGNAKLTKSETEEELHAAKQELDETKATLSADESYLAELKEDCSVKAGQWSERQKSAAEEQAAITKAKEILETGVTVLLQTGNKVALKTKGMRASELLRKLGKQFGSAALMQLANRAKSDPFGKIRGLINDMIEKLVKEAAEEADQKAFCDEENSKSRASKDKISAKLDKVAVRIEKAEAGKAKLSEAIKLLESEIADMDAATAEATTIRQEEHAEYEKASKDYRDSADAVARAINVLQEYYSQGAFVQTAQPDFGGAKTDVASTIISILEMAEGDFTRLLAESEASEESAAGSYQKLTNDNKVAKVTKQGDIKGKASEAKQLESALLNYKEDHATLGSELDAVLQYIDKLKPQCETKVMSYAEKKAKREQEIAGLKEALTILSAEGTSFIETNFLVRRA